MKVAFVGMTLEGTPEIVSPDGIASVDFNDEADSVNALVPLLKQRGVEAIVVLLHEGGAVQGGTGGSIDLIDSCNGPAAPNARTARPAPIVDVVNRMDDEIDIVVTGHTNWAVNCLIDGKVVTGAASQGRLITDIDAKIDRNTKDFVPGSITVDNKIVDPRRRQGAGHHRASSPSTTSFAGADRRGRRRRDDGAPLTRRRTSTPTTSDSQLGRLIADAQLAAPVGRRGADRVHEPRWHPRRPRCRARSPTARRSASSRSATS